MIERLSFFGDEPHAKEPTINAVDPLGVKKVHSKVSPKMNENEDRIQPSLEQTDKSTGIANDHDNSVDENRKSAKGEVAISAEDDGWTTPDNSLSEWEDNALEGTVDSSHEGDVKLEDYDSFENEPKLTSNNEDLGDFREDSEEGLPEEDYSAELESSETGEATLKEEDTVMKSDTKKRKVLSKKDRKLNDISKKKKISTKERKKRVGKDETKMSEEDDANNATIDTDDINREEINKNIGSSDIEDPVISNVTDLKLNTSSNEDVPLVDSLKTTAEVAMEVAEGAGSATSTADTSPSSSEEPIAENVPVSLTQLLTTPPLKFDNEVIANKFDGTALELFRPSTEVPWNIKMAFVGSDVLLSKLPQVANEKKDHPYLKYLGVMPDGNVRCAVESMNGTDLLMASKLEKVKLMETVKKCTKLSMVLKVLR
ncbi:unnamed protein product [Phytomonas sp. Hart1]|nr:unnamed protein product [Phytomonas sp. Hart1]|eukprot:CCW71983.1 unnamed protein product [Phytomonas sp. isolate Hart1]